MSLIITNEYLKKYNVDTICIPSNRFQNEIDEWYGNLKNINIIKVKYTDEISTTSIINKLKEY